MKLLFFSFSDDLGGAAKASFLLFKLVKDVNKNSFFLCVDKKKRSSYRINNFLNYIFLFILRLVEKIVIIFNRNDFHQSLNIFKSFNLVKLNKFNADVINLHWINRCAISLQEILKINSKILISLHDMWFLNGSSHYSITPKKNFSIIENYILKIKKKIFDKKNIFFLAHTKWMYKKALEKNINIKKLFLCEYYPIDTNLFKPRNKKKLKKKFNIPSKKKIILFSAHDINDKRKGEIYFYKILKHFKNDENFYFIIVGGGKLNISFKDFQNLSFFQYMHHMQLAEIYALSDIYICTSIIDNLPLTILEAMSSGLMVISFDNGGSKEVLLRCGYIVKNKSYQKIINILKNVSRSEILKKSLLSRSFSIKNFSKKVIQKKYIKIINKIHVL